MALVHSPPLGCLLATSASGAIPFGKMGNDAAAPVDVVALSSPVAPPPGADDGVKMKVGLGPLFPNYDSVVAF